MSFLKNISQRETCSNQSMVCKSLVEAAAVGQFRYFPPAPLLAGEASQEKKSRPWVMIIT